MNKEKQLLKNTIAGLLAAHSISLISPAYSEELIAEYLTWLDAKDTLTSKGVKLDSFSAVLA